MLLKTRDPLPSPGISYVAPHLNNLYFLPLCRRWGVYAVVRGLFLLKLGLSLLMLLAGPDRPGLLCFFIARYALPTLCPHTSASTPLTLAPLSMGSNRVFTEGTCKLLTLVVTDLVDEDLVLNHRKQAASALLFGMVALVTKPGQTFAPLLGTWLLCFYTGEAPCPSTSGSGEGGRRAVPRPALPWDYDPCWCTPSCFQKFIDSLNKSAQASLYRMGPV